MDKLKNNVIIDEFASESILLILQNMFLCMVILSTIGWFYKKYSRSLGGKNHVATILPLIGITVFLVITVVKSSLALSLGLVGALSIVRFRTPIKEPEELAYLFLTIAVGVGFGAGYKVITILVTLSILIFIRIFSGKVKSSHRDGEYSLVIKLSKRDKNIIESIENSLDRVSLSIKLNRFEQSENNFILYYNINLKKNLNFSG